MVLWRIVTARYRNGRKMLERMSRKELEGLNQDDLKKEGLEGVYRDVLKKKKEEEFCVLNEWARRNSEGKPYKVEVVRKDEEKDSNKSNKSATKGQGESLPLLRILALSGQSVDEVIRMGDVPPVNLVGFKLMKEDKLTTCLIPTLARDGHVSFVFAGTMDDFNRMQKDVSARFARRLGEIRLTNMNLTNFLVVGFTLAFPEDPNRMFLVYEALVSPEPILEMADIYNRLKSVTDSKNASELQSYFADGMRKKWLNEFIEGIEKLLDWPEFVAEGTRNSNRTKKS